MLRQKSGRIINVGSISAIMVTPFGGIYSGSKADLHAISEALRLELLPFGIKVITIITGAVKSSISKKAKIELKENSIYSSISKVISERTNMSQISSTNVEEYAKKFFRAVTKNNPASSIIIGKGAKRLSFLKLVLPNKLLDKIRRKRFRLSEL
jgi:short-subunit dehydrogenase